MFNLTVGFAFSLSKDAAAFPASLFAVVITLTIASQCVINHESRNMQLVDVQLAQPISTSRRLGGTTAALLKSETSGQSKTT
jgi:hypothetical protein